MCIYQVKNQVKKSEEEGNILEYRPKEYFGDDFATTMDEYTQSILKECSYENHMMTRFNVKDFNIKVNGSNKETYLGKGYRALLNAVIVMMVRKDIANHEKYAESIYH